MVGTMQCQIAPGEPGRNDWPTPEPRETEIKGANIFGGRDKQEGATKPLRQLWPVLAVATPGFHTAAPSHGWNTNNTQRTWPTVTGHASGCGGHAQAGSGVLATAMGRSLWWGGRLTIGLPWVGWLADCWHSKRERGHLGRGLKEHSHGIAQRAGHRRGSI